MLKKFLDPFRLLRGEERERHERANARKPLIVIGLANPGAKYRGTRHNVGAMCVDELARRTGARLENKVRDTELAETEIGEAPAIIARPITYVNESGKSVRNILRKFNAGPDRLLLVVDDIDLKIGRLRLRAGGSSGGHNGLKSITAHLRTQDYLRVRIGVGRPPGRQSGADHVLRRPGRAEATELAIVVQEAADAVEAILADGVDAAMGRFNDRS